MPQQERLRLGMKKEKGDKKADTATDYMHYHDGRILVHCYGDIYGRLHCVLLQKTAVYS